MRMPIFLAFSLLALSAAPVTEAAHIGPCSHQYVEIALYIATTKDTRGGSAYALGCVKNTPADLCDVLAICTLS